MDDIDEIERLPGDEAAIACRVHNELRPFHDARAQRDDARRPIGYACGCGWRVEVVPTAVAVAPVG